MSEVETTAGDREVERECAAAPPCPHQLRTARANLLEALSMKFTNLFTAVIANCEMAAMELNSAHPAFAFLASAKQAAHEASEANGRLRALVKECREANR